MEERTDIILLKSSDERAFERIYQRHWLKVYRFTGLFLADRQDREDILQGVFMRLWKMRARLDEDKDLDPLLFVITRNHIFKSFRSKVNLERLEAAMLMSSEDSAQNVEVKDLREKIDALISMLPERQKEAFTMSRYEGASYKQIADKMGISEKGVEKHISTAIRSIKNNLS